MDEAITKEGFDPNQLTFHADDRASMASHSIAEFLATPWGEKEPFTSPYL
jgi:putative transposase